MRRRATAAALLAGALCLLAQSNTPAGAPSGVAPSRDEYRAAYKSWREADPGLERDARTAGEALKPRTEKAAEAAAAYGASRGAFLQATAARQGENLRWLRELEVRSLAELSPVSDLNRFTNRELGAVTAGAAAFLNDPDKAIQPLRQAFQREQAALEILKTAVAARQKAEDKAANAAVGVEDTRAKALAEYPFLASAMAQSADLMNQETAAWAAYYPALAEAARTPAPPPVSAVPTPAVQPTPASVAPRVPSITSLPLSRYVGVWAFQAGGLSHGSEPEFVDFAVHEENGHASGTLYARFKLPPGTAGDPVVRFEFSGDLQPTRNQTFALQTSDGLKGTVDLIPGGPFNVLEVNFETEIKAGKIHQGDMLLVKQ